MKTRYIQASVERLCFADQKMAFVSGPRRCGKTTMARMMLERRESGAYHNWDDIEFRRMWTKSPRSTLPTGTDGCPLVVYDEIHKAKSWKRTLKGVYDTKERPVDIMVTGSARLNVYRRGSDSLLGRYYHFRLHPFSLGELTGTSAPSPEDLTARLAGLELAGSGGDPVLEDLLRYGPFPEPFLAQDEKKANLWRRNRMERLVREDLRDLTRTLELSQIEMLASLLPEKVGALLSVASLREDLEVSFGTVKRWLNWLKELYYVFEIKPFTGSIKRSIRKEGKLFMWDFSEVRDEPARFENLIACALLKLCHYWTDLGEGVFELCFLRDKEKHEIDFLITKDGRPWLPVEAKMSDDSASPNWQRFFPSLSCTAGVQVTAREGVLRRMAVGKSELLIVSAPDFLKVLV